MNVNLHLQELDDLIIEHTRPPATTILRNKLSTLREQMEAYVATNEQVAADVVKLKQAHTALQEEHAKLKNSQQPEPPNWGSKPPIGGRMGPPR